MQLQQQETTSKNAAVSTSTSTSTSTSDTTSTSKSASRSPAAVSAPKNKQEKERGMRVKFVRIEDIDPRLSTVSSHTEDVQRIVLRRAILMDLIQFLGISHPDLQRLECADYPTKRIFPSVNPLFKGALNTVAHKEVAAQLTKEATLNKRGRLVDKFSKESLQSISQSTDIGCQIWRYLSNYAVYFGYRPIAMDVHCGEITLSPIAKRKNTYNSALIDELFPSSLNTTTNTNDSSRSRHRQ
jgi:hypothetical protein